MEIKCNCADVPPTMPTCRDTHLESCPVWQYEQRAKQGEKVQEERLVEALRDEVEQGVFELTERAGLAFAPEDLWPNTRAAEEEAWLRGRDDTIKHIRGDLSWSALGRVRQELVEAANMATAEAANAKHVTKDKAAFSYQRGRADALFEAERMIRDAMEVEDA